MTARADAIVTLRGVFAGLPHRGKSWLQILALYVLSVGVAFGLSALLVQLTGNSASSALTAMYQGSLQDGSSLATTLDEATPLLIVALGTILCTKAGIFNIGQEGQLIFGAMIGTVVALKTPGPGWFVLSLTLIGAATGGAFWAGVAALLRYWRRVDVVISTLLLTFVAFEIVEYAVNSDYLLRETAIKGEITNPESNMIRDDLRLTRIGDQLGFNVSVGCLMALVLAIVVVFVITRTRWGFRLRLLGLNRVVAHSTGVSEARTGGTALVLCGAFAGLAGGVMLTATVFRVQAGFSNNVGFNGLLVALVAQGQALVAVPVAFLFGAMRSGGGFLASTGVPRFLVDVVQALLVLAAVFPPAFRALRAARRPTAAPETQAEAA